MITNCEIGISFRSFSLSLSVKLLIRLCLPQILTGICTPSLLKFVIFHNRNGKSKLVLVVSNETGFRKILETKHLLNLLLSYFIDRYEGKF